MDGTEYAAILDTSVNVDTTPVRTFTMAPALIYPSTISETAIFHNSWATEVCGKRIPNIFYAVNVYIGQL